MSVAEGMAAMLAMRRERLDRGERPLGWKLGFGAPAAQERFGLDRPLVGFLTDAGVLADGARVPIGGWASPALEPEIAVHLERDVAHDATPEQAATAIGGLSAAIELADVDPPPSDPTTILAGNIFHRHVILGPVDRGRNGAAGITGALERDGEEVARTEAPEALTGRLADVLALTAATLAEHGERLRAGEVVITGSVVPPLEIAPGQRVTARLNPLGSLSVELV